MNVVPLQEIEDDDDEDEEDEEDEDEEYDEEEEEMSAMIEASLSEALELPTADGKYEKVLQFLHDNSFIICTYYMFWKPNILFQCLI